jgi:hypothetical protein
LLRTAATTSSSLTVQQYRHLRALTPVDLLGIIWVLGEHGCFGRYPQTRG